MKGQAGMPASGGEMDTVESRASNRIELRVLQSMATSLDALMTVNNEGRAISFPVHTQLGMAIKVSVGGESLSLREGKLFIQDVGRTAPKSSKKATYGLVHYLSGIDLEAECQEQFHVRLYVPSQRYDVIWDLAARGHLPRLVSLQVKGLDSDAEWDVSNIGSMLLIEDYSFSFPVNSYGLHGPTK
jgi:hypothetical protein